MDDLINPCLDCGALAGQECDSSCPSAAAVELEAETHADAPCCPSPQAAARSLCGCWGLGAGAWVGSAA